ncbi:hypothetical protein BP6252_10621 [Coleophoma cylindrospora]|uniref:Centrosomin N-terminal motif 1 domain-containing protein n=1 Tax=Coleophoma cylindrospora TaxID=1849047 RepID=A0A3D8QTI4_9HELO|nr:hypothetical protein BP6252_10621 [Coleophoma cylindrospora]
MEDGLQQRRNRTYARPESSCSRDTKMTPSNSSNASTVATLPPRHTQKGRQPGGASMLQERLRDRKVESARHQRQNVGLHGLDDRGIQSSPIKARHTREERRPSSSGNGMTPSAKNMGAKHIEDQVSTLHKQNFDLKLELYHRRERQEKLEARLAAAEERLIQQDELQEVNEELLAELEKRDQAVEEAVDIICNLEAKVETLMREREIVRKFDAQESDYFQSNHQNTSPSSPPGFTPTSTEEGGSSQKTNLVSSHSRLPKMPSFFSEQSEGTEALRSLYLPVDRGHSGMSLPKLAEDADEMNSPHSPRLSVLSESSFLSVYGEKPLALDFTDGQEDLQNSLPTRRHRTSTSIEKWIDERPSNVETPSKPSPNARKVSGRQPPVLSIGSVLQSPLQRLERGEHRLERLRIRLEQGNQSLALRHTETLDQSASGQEKQESKEIMRRMATDKRSFDRQQALPPTPDTVSTSTLRLFKNSNDTLHDRARQVDGNRDNYVGNGARLPSLRTVSNPQRLLPSARPRSQGESISRPTGLGWDTGARDDEGDSILSTASTYDNPETTLAPDYFGIGTQAGLNWARDVMFNHDSSAQLPTHRTNFYDETQRASREPHSNTPGTENLDEQRNYETSRVNNEASGYAPSSPDASPRPSLPPRRASLSTGTKLRKTQRSLSYSRQNSPALDVTSSPPSKEPKRSRFSGLFGRSSTSPSVNGSFNNQQIESNLNHNSSPDAGNIKNYTDYRRCQSQGTGMITSKPLFDEERLSSATPPPILRSRPTQAYARPSSAGAGAVRRRSTLVTDYCGEEPKVRISCEEERRGAMEDANGKGGRKWLGKLSRAGSLNKRT